MQTLSQILAPSSTKTTTAKSTCDWQPELDAYEPSLVAAATAATAIVREMEAGAPGRWLTLTGKPGCGKTMLACQILERSRRSNPGRHASWPGLTARPGCRFIDEAKFADKLRGGEYGLVDSFANDWFVVFDDLGSARDRSAFVADMVYRFCNARLGKWTVFTSNFNLREIQARIDDRVASRLIRDSNVGVRIKAEDYALRDHQATPPAGSA